MFGLTILGNNSALPAHDRHPTSQALHWHNQIFLIDCGEGTQLQMQRYKIRPGKIAHIFISHLHGDHYFGLVGLLTSLNLAGRTSPLHVYAPAPLLDVLNLQLSLASTTLKYPFHFHALEGEGVVMQEAAVRVSCFHVTHRIPCYGFLFEEIKSPRRIDKNKASGKRWSSEVYQLLHDGKDAVADDGTVLSNAEWTLPSAPPKKYAYCADTLYMPGLAEQLHDATLLYHEATFTHDMLDQAVSRFHTTARQAGEFAAVCKPGRLLIGHFSSRYAELEVFREEVRQYYPASDLAIEGVTYLF